MNDLDTLIKVVLDELPTSLFSPLRRLYAIEDGIELLGKFISTMADPSSVTLEEIREERKKGELSSKHNWRW